MEGDSSQTNSQTSSPGSGKRKRAAPKVASAGKQRRIANYEPSKQEEIRRANRLAARECRKRKKQMTQNLESALEEVKNENQLLQGQYNALTTMVNQLKVQHMAATTQNPQQLNFQCITPSVQTNSLSGEPVAQSSSALISRVSTMNPQLQQNNMSQNQGLQRLTPITLAQNSQMFQPMFPIQTQSNAQNPAIQAIMQQAMGMGTIDPFLFQQIQSQLQQQISANNIYSGLAQMMGQGMTQGIGQTNYFTGLPNLQMPIQGMNSMQMSPQDMNQLLPNLNNPQFMTNDSFSRNQITSSSDTNNVGNDTDLKPSAA